MERASAFFCIPARVSSKWKKKIRFKPKQTETRSVSRLFRFVSWNQNKNFSVCFGVSNLYRVNRNKQNCFETNRNNPECSEKSIIHLPRVLCLHIETTETNRTVSKQTETIRNVLKNLSYSYLGSSVCISKQPKQTELFRNEPKQSGMFWKIYHIFT